MLRLVLSLLICVPAFALLGAKVMENKGHALLPGLILGVVVRAFFGKLETLYVNLAFTEPRRDIPACNEPS